MNVTWLHMFMFSCSKCTHYADTCLCQYFCCLIGLWYWCMWCVRCRCSLWSRC